MIENDSEENDYGELIGEDTLRFTRRFDAQIGRVRRPSDRDELYERLRGPYERRLSARAAT